MTSSSAAALAMGSLLALPAISAAQDPSVSPDHRPPIDAVAPLPVGRLVYTSDRAGDGGLNVWVLEAGESEPRQLTEGDVNDFTPRISPSGETLAFASDRDNPMGLTASDSFLRFYDLYLMDLSSSEVIELHRSRTFKMRPTWSPDGTRIAFDGEDPDGERMEETGGLTPQIWVMPSDGSGPPEALTAEVDGASKPDWSPDGSRIAYSTVARGRIIVIDVGTGETAALSEGPGDDGPSWSPDGTRIAFSSQRSGDAEIWVMDADGSEATQLTHSPGYDGQVDWSPDGTMLAYASDRGGDGRDIHVMAADGSGQVNVSGNPASDDGQHRGSDFSPSWSD